MSAETWSNGIGGLSEGLSRLVGDKIASRLEISNNYARKRGDRYFLIKRKVDYATLKKLKELPIFREGQYKGGFMAQAENRRILPHSELAARTIGYLNWAMKVPEVGIEGSFDKDLAGKNGVVISSVLRAATGSPWMMKSVDSKDGNDVVTTIDVDLQDVATTSLLRISSENIMPIMVAQF